MDDKVIVQMYLNRDEDAILKTKEKKNMRRTVMQYQIIFWEIMRMHRNV
mgnify:CR=1 FL=1